MDEIIRFITIIVIVSVFLRYPYFIGGGFLCLIGLPTAIMGVLGLLFMLLEIPPLETAAALIAFLLFGGAFSLCGIFVIRKGIKKGGDIYEGLGVFGLLFAFVSMMYYLARPEGIQPVWGLFVWCVISCVIGISLIYIGKKKKTNIKNNAP